MYETLLVLLLKLLDNSPIGPKHVAAVLDNWGCLLINIHFCLCLICVAEEGTRLQYAASDRYCWICMYLFRFQMHSPFFRMLI